MVEQAFCNRQVTGSNPVSCSECKQRITENREQQMSIIGTKEHTATIAINANLSDAVELKGYSILRIAMPAVWTAADLTFQVSDDGGTTFRNMYWDWGPEMVIDAAAAITIELSPFVRLSHIDQIKVRSGTAGTPVNQAAERLILLAVSTKG